MVSTGVGAASAAARSALVAVGFVDPATAETRNFKVRLRDPAAAASVDTLVELIADRLASLAPSAAAVGIDRLTYVDAADGKTYDLSDDDLPDVLAARTPLTIVLKDVVASDTRTDTDEDDVDDAGLAAYGFKLMTIPLRYLHMPSYRVSSEQQTAKLLWYELALQSGLHPFLDHECLNEGEQWEGGFLTGLSQSGLVVLLCSEAGLSRAKMADKKPDNVILEWEIALELQRDRGVDILPVFLKSKKNLRDSGTGRVVNAVVDFFPDVNDFPDAHHCHALSPRRLTVRAVVKEILRLQAVITEASDLQRSSGLLRLDSLLT
ncbi:hypothetical protein HK405_005850 [Cladochytrium tenue]|nr:hypothetical protein HK405_005850 [Cladochytrium tenue]